MAASPSHRKTILTRVAIGFFAVAGLASILAYTADQTAKRSLQAKVSEAQSLGLGTDISFFGPNRPEVQNAFLFVKNYNRRIPAKDIRTSDPGSYTHIPPHTKQLANTPFDKAKTIFELEIATLPIQVWQDASNLPYWKSTNSQEFNLALDPVSSVTPWASFFADRAKLHARLGNWKNSEADFLTAARIANLVAQEKTPAEQLIKARINALILARLSELIIETNADPKSTDMFDHVLANLAPAEYLDALGGECAEWIIALDEAKNEKHSFLESIDWGTDQLHTPANFNRIKSDLLDHFMEIAKVYNEYKNRPDLIMRALSSVPDPSRPSWQGESDFLEMFAGDQLSTYTLITEDTVNFKLTKVGVAILKFQRANNRLPKTLEELTNVDITDPYTNRPLKYKVESNGFVVYSVGSDQSDNQGDFGEFVYDICFQTINRNAFPVRTYTDAF